MGAPWHLPEGSAAPGGVQQEGGREHAKRAAESVAVRARVPLCACAPAHSLCNGEMHPLPLPVDWV